MTREPTRPETLTPCVTDVGADGVVDHDVDSSIKCHQTEVFVQPRSRAQLVIGPPRPDSTFTKLAVVAFLDLGDGGLVDRDMKAYLLDRSLKEGGLFRSASACLCCACVLSLDCCRVCHREIASEPSSNGGSGNASSCVSI